MQIDMHHTGTYVLCRMAGMKSQYAQIVAYAAQQVDDATYDHALRFTDGSVFHQTMTQHQSLSKPTIDVNNAIKIWLPFHFLPGGMSGTNPDGLITQPESTPLHALLERVMQVGSTPLGLYWLGITLHVYADTYTHQDFKGLYDKHNDITLLDGYELNGFWGRIRKIAVNRLTNILPIGHTQALRNPDIPFISWAYQREPGKVIRVENLRDRFLPASKNMYHFLCNFVRRNRQFSNRMAIPNFGLYENLLVRFIELLTRKASKEERHQIWLEKIHSNAFNFPDFDEIDANLTYAPRDWFHSAVTAEKVKGLFKRLEYKAYNYHMFTKKPGFAKSHWVKFMRAAAQHQYLLVHDILPACGILVG